MKKFKWLAIIFIAVFAIYFPVYLIQISDVNRERDGCERLNVLRVQVYDIVATVVNAPAPPPSQRTERFNEILELYKITLNHLVSSASEYAIKEGSVRVDCSQAYKQPWPLQ